jgi:hypothetical protein
MLHLIPSFCSCSAAIIPSQGGSNLDQDAFAFDSLIFIKRDQTPRLFYRAFHIEGVANIGLGRDAAGNNLQHRTAESHQEMINDVFELRCATQSGCAAIG